MRQLSKDDLPPPVAKLLTSSMLFSSSSSRQVEHGVEENTLYFLDGKRRIDLILAYTDKEDDDGKEEDMRRKRQTFQENILNEGLDLEEEDKKVLGNDLRFLFFIQRLLSILPISRVHNHLLR